MTTKISGVCLNPFKSYALHTNNHEKPCSSQEFLKVKLNSKYPFMQCELVVATLVGYSPEILKIMVKKSQKLRFCI